MIQSIIIETEKWDDHSVKNKIWTRRDGLRQKAPSPK